MGYKKANKVHTPETVKPFSRYSLLNFILGFFLCKHDYGWESNIHGDEINAVNARSWWCCNKCGTYTTKKELYEV